MERQVQPDPQRDGNGILVVPLMAADREEEEQDVRYFDMSHVFGNDDAVLYQFPPGLTLGRLPGELPSGVLFMLFQGDVTLNGVRYDEPMIARQLSPLRITSIASHQGALLLIWKREEVI